MKSFYCPDGKDVVVFILNNQRKTQGYVEVERGEDVTKIQNDLINYYKASLERLVLIRTCDLYNRKSDGK